MPYSVLMFGKITEGKLHPAREADRNEAGQFWSESETGFSRGTADY